MAVSQDYVNQLVREAATAAGGTLSYTDVANAAANLGIPLSQVNAAMSTGVIAAPTVEDVVSQLSPGQAQNIGGVVYQPVYDSTGQGETFEQGPLKEVLVYNQNQQTGDAYKQYTPTGEYIKAGQFKDTGNFGDLLKDAYTAVGPIAMAALTAGGAGSLLGSSLGLTGTAANVAGGALLGGGNAALTGGNVLKGAVLGGATSYVSSLINAGVTDPDLLQAAYDADIAGGMIPEFGTNAAYDTFMQSAMTPEAMAAIEAQIANSSVAGLTPAQIAAQGGMLTDIAAGTAMGPMTPEQLGQSFEEYMAQNGYTPTTGMTAEQLAAVNALGGVEAAGVGKVAGGGLLSSLTPTQIASLVKAGVSVAGLAGAAKAIQPTQTTKAPMQAPTQGVPTNDPNYYNQLQQYYNSYLPQTPRDVVTPLQQWYNAKSGA